jgi:hypothetical protein
MRYRSFFALVAGFVAACTSSEDLGVRPDSGTGPTADAGDAGGPGADSGSDALVSDGGTAGPDADAEVDAAGWTPKQLTGLSLWLDDTVGVVKDPGNAGRVKRWLDQSGQGNNADGSGGDGVTMLPALNPAAVGGKDAIDCDLQTYFTIADAPSLKFGTGDFGIVLVSMVTAPGSLVTKASGDLSLTLTPESTLTLSTSGAGAGVALLAGTPTTKFSVIAARGAALRVQVGTNTATGAVSTSDVSNSNAPWSLCRSSQSQKISLAEVIAVKGTLTDADLAKTLGYLNSKFGL